jgi:hypothetical protein
MASGQLDLHYFKAVPQEEEWSKKSEKNIYSTENVSATICLLMTSLKNPFFILFLLRFLGPTQKYPLGYCIQ